ncbi:MAG TPA: hypothetical protein VKV15_18620 [Bryobacteraceae bacterium]|nr:hypothetical protein [Bryobacteraceae bacterium]
MSKAPAGVSTPTAHSFCTLSGIPVRPVYTAQDLAAFDPARDRKDSRRIPLRGLPGRTRMIVASGNAVLRFVRES